MKKTGVILIGYIIMMVAFLFIGPSIIFGLDNNSIILTVIGIILMGLGSAATIIPLLPDMIEAIEENYDKNVD